MSATDYRSNLAQPCYVVMRNAKHSDGRTGDAYIGADLQFSTLDPTQARVFPRWQAKDYRDHWAGWYYGFAGGVTLEVVEA